MKAIPLALIGLGPLGRAIAADGIRRGRIDVQAAIDLDPELVGRPLAELVDGAPSDVRVQGSLQAVADWSAIHAALVTTVSDLEACADTLRELLRRKVSVVSTCEELSWPWLRHPVLAAELHEQCVKKRVHVLGTGVNPGYLMDALPTIVSHACNGVRRISVERVQDASKRRVPFQRKIGAGLDPEAFARRREDGSLRHVGLGESLHFLAHHTGLSLERWDEELEPVVADARLDCDLGPIEPGHARGVRQIARGYQGEHVVLELVFHAACGEPKSFDRIEVDADPPLELVFRGGVHGDVATSAIVLNSLRPLLAAEPGLHTMGSIPLTGSGN